MSINRSIGEKIFDRFNVIFLVLLSIVMLYPFWYVLVQSFMPYSEIIKSNFYIIPKKITFEAYRYVFSNASLLSGLYYSIFVTVVGTIYQLLITSMAAYAVTKKDLPGRDLFFIMVIITMFFGGGLIPYYLVIRQLGLINNIMVLVIPAAISSWNLILMKEYFKSLGTEMEESAKIDGAGYFRIFFTIILPLSGPILSTIALFIAVGHWNNWFGPILFLNDKRNWPIAALLRDILVAGNTDLTKSRGYVQKEFLLQTQIKMAVVMISVIPIIIVYPFVQKYFVKGVMIGSVKG